MHFVRIITRAEGTCLLIRGFEKLHEEKGPLPLPVSLRKPLVFFRSVKLPDRVNESASIYTRLK